MSILNPSEASLSQPSFTLSSRAFRCAMAICQTSQDLVEVMVQCHGLPKGSRHVQNGFIWLQWANAAF